jgi:ribosomal protein S18 acetylase RimI-like enzyme
VSEDVRIEELKVWDKQELLDLFTQAFEGGHPLVPALSSKPGATRAVMKAFLNFFGATKSSALYGIRKDGKLVCASLSLDSTTQPSAFALIRFIFALSWTLGWRSAKELEVVHREEPKYEGRYLELVILGTLPAYQRQGLGSKMLRFLYEKAREGKYKGITLVADKDTPAFNLYLKEGYIVDKEFKVGERTLCWMRLELHS